MFLVNWLYSALSYLDFFQKNAKLVFLGLDNSGKSTLIQMLNDGKLCYLQPTVHPESVELIIGGIRYRAFDLVGHENARKMRKDYLLANVDGIVFMVDSSDRERFDLSRNELDELMSMEELQNVPFIILGNKIDLDDAASEEELRNALGLETYKCYGKDLKSQTGVRPIELFMCSVARRAGYAEGFQWLSQFIN
ncbi:unnamed protein product [Blepharisma stoltei]|uniref:GTP-binding protein sar1 n=1 Tax=Blepharisma stoltei TaxID=1481888 RepID=A0AAU9K3D2_9CILI|nr:unnamed protein product [Blepharisma stoltei]